MFCYLSTLYQITGRRITPHDQITVPLLLKTFHTFHENGNSITVLAGDRLIQENSVNVLKIYFFNIFLLSPSKLHNSCQNCPFSSQFKIKVCTYAWYTVKPWCRFSFIHCTLCRYVNCDGKSEGSLTGTPCSRSFTGANWQWRHIWLDYILYTRDDPSLSICLTQYRSNIWGKIIQPAGTSPLAVPNINLNTLY